MTSEFGVHLSVVLLTLAAVMAAVGLHYEGLSWLARRLAQGKGPHRRRVLRGSHAGQHPALLTGHPQAQAPVRSRNRRTPTRAVLARIRGLVIRTRGVPRGLGRLGSRGG